MVTAARPSRVTPAVSDPSAGRSADTSPTAARLRLAPGTAWADVFARARDAAPEAFGDGRLHNLWGGRWRPTGVPLSSSASPVDATPIAGPPMIEIDEAREAIGAALAAHQRWRDVSLADRRARVAAAVDALDAHRDTLALLLVWEIGKPWRLARTDVDRAIDGVRWYLDEIEGMLADRAPLPGPVSNIASWNYPMSVLMHAVLVQVLAGNAVIAKTPTDGGAACLTLACALAHREGLPISLVSGPGSRLSGALVRAPEIGALAFVGGRSAGGQVAAALVDTGKRHFLEQEGLNAWGIWEFSQWDLLAGHLRKGFEYGKQRCTAYPRYVVQRQLFDQFLQMYLPVVESVRFGHPLAVATDDEPLPDLDFGPLINAVKAAELAGRVDEAITKGGVPLHRGRLTDGRFLPGQDTAAYAPPVAILSPPSSCALHHAEPFGPVDTIVLVDSEAELLAAMNASNGALVASLACDDEDKARRMSAELAAFKIGINKPRSRGDRAEPFGGRGASWKGAFVGGEHLVRAVTVGPDPDERLYGNFPSYSLYPRT
ncbi:aldehyde dehydrogenase family protein [Frankia sp. CNm7]|uniref:Aldehyde dehydrogenase family protein n=1 Tax=Frankia nepalensis TaxID=1836974 RepID=A0A937UUB5_9ACTN|nr:aldehyde dehydrogenase family protein [Frankia nepalensis]MBL7502325.1 aldehyde dehydrogenase family protein [Frankia nepalensis]MBL7511610.1 aldehyde dehydrogenase family protein [Frankia nepalensis]MBL7519925.1 aldehyde dehydrogenase family protein [Frankia nepalensis]MBL7632085.1 aldehyde dehydrogenase family protein [Frankia nepalensis]